MYTLLTSCLLARWMLPESTYILLLLGFINFLFGVFYFKREWTVYTITTMSSNIFPWHCFILNYLFPIGLIQFSRACIVLLPWKPSLHTIGQNVPRLFIIFHDLLTLKKASIQHIRISLLPLAICYLHLKFWCRFLFLNCFIDFFGS